MSGTWIGSRSKWRQVSAIPFVMILFCYWLILKSCDFFSVYIYTPSVHELLFFTFVISGFPAPSLSFVTGWTSGSETPSSLFSLPSLFSLYQYIFFFHLSTLSTRLLKATPLGPLP